MKRILLIFLILYTICAPTNEFYAHAQKSSVEVRANLRHAHYLFDQGDYEGASSKLNRVLTFDPNNAEAKNLLNQCNRYIEQQRQARDRAEYEAFEKAKQTGTKAALSQFVAQFPKSKYAAQANGMIEDFDLWSIARRTNTIESYNYYLQQSKNQSFADEARAKIANLEAETQWHEIRNTNNLSELQTFVSKYPQSEHIAEANPSFTLKIIFKEF